MQIFSSQRPYNMLNEDSKNVVISLSKLVLHCNLRLYGLLQVFFFSLNMVLAMCLYFYSRE